jgi:hypothetical protein
MNYESEELLAAEMYGQWLDLEIAQGNRPPVWHDLLPAVRNSWRERAGRIIEEAADVAQGAPVDPGTSPL